MAKTNPPETTEASPEPTTTLDYAAIWEDFRFFLDHSGKPQQSAQAFVDEVIANGPKGRPLRILEFGAGMGDSLDAFLNAGKFTKEDIALSIVEHDAEKLEQCVTLFKPRSSGMIVSATELSDLPKSFHFDVILCNHVLYYVPKLQETLEGMLAHLAADGLLLLVIGGHDNTQVRMWMDAYAAAGKPLPHHHGASVEVALGKIPAPWSMQEVPASLRFPDKKENRLKVLRFLFGKDLSSLPESDLLALFDPYTKDGDIIADHKDWLFTISPRNVLS